MNNWKNHLWNSLNEEKKNKKDRPWYTYINPMYWIGRLAGSAHQAVDKGYSDGYGGIKHKHVFGYEPEEKHDH